MYRWIRDSGPLASRKGFSVIELLIVVAIIGLLTTLVLYGVGASKDKARDNAVRNAVRQMRWEAEIVYDTNGGSYRNWTTAADIQASLTVLKQAIDENYGQANQYVLCDNQHKEFCVSAPLRSENGAHYCVDATGVFVTASVACNCSPSGSPPAPLRCATASP